MTPDAAISKPNTAVGILLAALVCSAWLAVHLYSLFGHSLSAPLWQTLSLIALQCWLYVGIFIVAHDTIHGALFPNRPKWNAGLGAVIMFIYAGFSWKLMATAHHQHHAQSGTAGDPDFNADDPHKFWPWYIKFFTTYFGLRQFLVLFGFTLLYIALGAPYLNTIIMWAVPAILSSVQLFYFGTYLTHRHVSEDGGGFPDHHNARTNSYPKWLSLLTCFHFGYHHEHHLFPNEPWWRLPYRKKVQAQKTLKQAGQ